MLTSHLPQLADHPRQAKLFNAPWIQAARSVTVACLLAFSFACVSLIALDSLQAQPPAKNANRLAYLDAFCDPYYVGRDFPKLTTPQWVGEPNVHAVVTLGIDDMRDTAKYETYLRPLLDRLKAIDGRAAVSIMTCKVPTDDPQLQSWLREGVSLETHTIDHPCPCLQGSDFDRAKSTYDRCVDLMFQVPNNHPVAFRFPCMDSLNTPSPRAFSEIVNRTTPAGNFLQASTSVTCLFTSDDASLPKSLTLNEDGSDRFRRYIPFPSFVNKVENYPYPFVIGRKCWEFPCTIPDDWQAQNIQQPNNPRTVTDMVAAVDATVLKRGMANIIFHPHGWIRAEQMVEVVDKVQQRHGSRVKFLTFKECVERITKNLLAGEPLRNSKGGDNGVRLVDVNNDGYLDVLIGNSRKRLLRIWQPADSQWNDQPSPLQFVGDEADGSSRDLGVRLGIVEGRLLAFAHRQDGDQSTHAMYAFDSGRFHPMKIPAELANVVTAKDGIDQGVRWRDLDRDGTCELIVANPTSQSAFYLQDNQWTASGFPHPIVNAKGLDYGTRFVDLDQDGCDDLVVSNQDVSAVHLYRPDQRKFDVAVAGIANPIPAIARDGANAGAWFAAEHMWIQNESTHRLPDGVDRRTFTQLLGSADPNPRSPDDALNSMRVRDGFQIELAVAEPLVMDPVAIDWGPDGKLWVVEMADYPLGLDDRGKPGGRVRFLEDKDGDGRYETSTLFLDEIPFPTGVMAWRDGVLVSAAPTVFFAKDTDGDGKADLRKELFRGFVEGNQQHRVNGFEWGLDNWVYMANGDSGGVVESVASGERFNLRGRDLRIRPETGEMQGQSGQTQFGRHRDSWGNWFGCSNPIPVRHYVLDDHYLGRNLYYAAPSAKRDIARVDNAQLFPISRVLSHWSGYKPPKAGERHKFTSACSTSVYRDTLFGDAFQQNTFTCEPVHNAVHRRILKPDGISFESLRPDDEQDREFLASTDSWFRPATVTTGPDGALWVVDMYRLVIEHPEWIDDQREKELFLRAGHDRGRIYRIFPKNKKPRTMPRLNDKPTAELVKALETANGRQCDMVQRLLVHRQDPASRQPLAELISSSQNPLTRLHALCTLDGINQITTDVLRRCLSDSHPAVRRHAIRIAETLISKSDVPTQLWNDIADTVDDEDAHVRLQLAYSLGFAEHKPDEAGQLLAELSARAGDDPFFQAAIFSSLNAKLLPAYYSAMNQRPVPAKYRDDVLRMASRMDPKLSRKMLAELVSGLLESFKRDVPDPAALVSAAAGLQAMRALANDQLPESLRADLAIAGTQAAEIALSDDAALSARISGLEIASAASQLAGVSLSWKTLTPLIDAKQPPPLQRSAIEAAALSSDPRIADELLKKLPQVSPATGREILGHIIAKPAWTARVFAQMESQALAPQLIALSHRNALLAHSDPKIQKAAGKWFGAVNANRRDLIEGYVKSMPAEGEPTRGAALFGKHCSVCHRVGAIGHAVGPDLTALKNRSLTAMLTAILDPNQAVEDKFQSYSVLTDDGRRETGIIAEESASGITLRMQEGKVKLIARSNIERIQNSQKSLMPEGVEKELPLEKMRDLLAYMEELLPPHKTIAGNQPAIIRSGAGDIVLAAAASRIYGPSLTFETGHSNLGFWGSVDDVARWSLECSRAGDYEVTLQYACPDNTAGSQAELTIHRQKLSATVRATKGWADYQELKLGTVSLKKGTQEISLRSTGPLRSFLFDLRSVTLSPK